MTESQVATTGHSILLGDGKLSFIDDDVEKVAVHESKVGEVRGTRVMKELDMDIALLKAGKVDSVVWHFFPSDVSSKLGPSMNTLRQMAKKAEDAGVNIQFVIHPPGV